MSDSRARSFFKPIFSFLRALVFLVPNIEEHEEDENVPKPEPREPLRGGSTEESTDPRSTHRSETRSEPSVEPDVSYDLTKRPRATTGVDETFERTRNSHRRVRPGRIERSSIDDEEEVDRTDGDVETPGLETSGNVGRDAFVYGDGENINWMTEAAITRYEESTDERDTGLTGVSELEYLRRNQREPSDEVDTGVRTDRDVDGRGPDEERSQNGFEAYWLQ